MVGPPSMSRSDVPSATVEIGTLRRSEYDAAAELLGEAFYTCPIHVAVFGAADEASRRRQVAMFRVVVHRLALGYFVARTGGRLVGVAGYIDSSRCQPPLLDRLRIGPAMAWALGTKMPRVMSWLGEWGSRDAMRAHCHFGPLAVSPALQGRGIGGRLLERFGRYADGTGAAAYLETDRFENVRLYRRCGFEVINEATVFGVRNWFMWRPPQRAQCA